MDKTVSVVVTTYGEPVNLSRALKSLEAQTLQRFETIVVDDNGRGSRNQLLAADIVSSFDKTLDVTYIVHEENKNGSAARNSGLRVATGRYVAFLDDDDEYAPERLCVLSELLDKPENARYGGAYTACEFFVAGKHHSFSPKISSGAFLEETLSGYFPSSTGSNLFIRTEIAKKLGGFDERFTRHQDYEFFVRFFRDYQLLAVEQVLVIKHQLNRNEPDVEKFEAVKKFYLETFSEDIERLGPDAKNRIYYHQNILLAESALKRGRYDAAKRIYQRAKTYRPITFRHASRRFLLALRSRVQGRSGQTQGSE